MFSLFTKNNNKSIRVTEINPLLNKINLIDIREPYEYQSGHIPTAKNIPMNTLLQNPTRYLDQAKEYYIVCQSGGRSSTATNYLVKNGFNVINVLGGTGSYNGKLDR